MVISSPTQSYQASLHFFDRTNFLITGLTVVGLIKLLSKAEEWRSRSDGATGPKGLLPTSCSPIISDQFCFGYCWFFRLWPDVCSGWVLAAVLLSCTAWSKHTFFIKAVKNCTIDCIYFQLVASYFKLSLCWLVTIITMYVTLCCR